MHEVLINILNKKDYCKTHGLGGFLVSADLRKAFDSVSHEFMEECYDFFNFGPQIKMWLKSIGIGRTACILTESGALSQPFKLGKGHAQGDSPSPLLYNFAQQIMLFKIELSPDIKKIRIPEPLPKIFNPEKFFEAESNNETEVCDCFADDNYSLTSDDIENLCTLEKYLKEFELLTGLGCNIDKTSLFILGNAEPIPTKFAITSTVKILGITIKSGEPVNVTNYNMVWEKIGKIMNYWSRFGLSMLGRITVIKTLILPHLSFIGCILEPPLLGLKKLQQKSKNLSYIAKIMLREEYTYRLVREDWG
jgi:hypothetical protein